MFPEEDKSYKKLSNHMNRVPIGSLDIAVLSIEKLIEMKREIDPPRGKDLLDISELQSIPDSNEKNG